MIFRTVAGIALALAAASSALAAMTKVDDVDVYWISEGEGPAIVLVHGWTCDTTVWTDQLTALASRYRVIALDLPGHGLSGAPASGQFTMDLYARAVEAVRAAAGAEEVVLVGHSMGAAVISQYALDYPDRVAGLIAADGALSPSFPAEGPPRPDGPFRQFREQMISSFFVPETRSHVRDKVLHVMLASSDERAMAVGAAMGSFSRPEGKKITAPTLVVMAGSRDEPDAEAMQELHDIAPRAQVRSIERTGHFLMMEEPTVFNDMLADFVEAIGF